MFAMPYDTRSAKNSYFTQEEKKDTDTVASSQMSESVMSETTDRDELSSLDDDRLLHLLHSSNTEQDSKRRSRRSKRKSRRKRGDSLERQISQLILGTASAVSDAHFELGKSPKQTGGDASSVEFILQDLVHPNSMELIPSMKSTPLSNSGSGTEKYITTIQSKLRESHLQPMTKMGKEFDPANIDSDFVASTKEASCSPSSHDLSPIVDIKEYDDPSLEINFSDEFENDGDSTQPEDDKSQPDDELGTISALSSNEFLEGHSIRKDVGTTGSFDSWSWREPHIWSKSAGENCPTSPVVLSSSPDSQGSHQPGTKAQTELANAAERGAQFLSRESQLSVIPDGKESLTQDSRQGKEKPKAAVKEKVLFKTNFDDWSPFMALELPFDDIRFSDTLVDPNEFERAGSVDPDGFLKAPPKYRAMKPLIWRSPTSFRTEVVETGRQLSENPAPSYRNDTGSVDTASVDTPKIGSSSHTPSPDSIFDHPSTAFHTRGRRLDPPGARDLHFRDYASHTLSTRIAI